MFNIQELNRVTNDFNTETWFQQGHRFIDSVEILVSEYIAQKGYSRHPESKIHETAIIGDNVFIDIDVSVGPYCYIKSNSILLSGVKLGYMVELDRCLLFERVKIAHQSCIGRCIIGSDSNLAYGFVVATKNLNQRPITSKMNHLEYSSNRMHHGCLIGANFKTGVNVSIMPGATILPNVSVSPYKQICGFIDANTIVK